MNKKQKGILFIMLAALFFASMSLFVRLAGDVPFIQKSFFRNFIAMIISIVVILKNKTGFGCKRENLKYLVLRSTFGVIGVIANIFAIEHLILSDSTTLNKLTPFFVIIFSYFVLKEKIKLWQGIGIVVAFTGCLFIVNPNLIIGILTGSKIDSSFNNFPSLIGVLGAVAAGGAYTMLRLLGLRGEKGTSIVFFFSTFSTIVTFPMMMIYYKPMSMYQLMCLLGAGTVAAMGQFCITAAYSNAPAKEISVYDYSQIMFSAFYGFMFFGQVPSKFSLIGYGMVILTAIFMFIKTNQETKENT